MSNGNSGFTKIYNSNNQFSTLTAGDINASNVDATVINGDQFVTVTGYTSNKFKTLAPASGATSPLMTIPNQTDATVITDARLLVLPARSVITKVVISNGGVGITPPANTFAVSFLPTTTVNVLTNAAAPLPGVPPAAATGIIVGSSVAGSGISGTDAATGSLTIFSNTLQANTATPGPVPTILSNASIGAIYPYVVSDSFVVIYNTTAATANSAGQLKVQITYTTVNL